MYVGSCCVNKDTYLGGSANKWTSCLSHMPSANSQNNPLGMKMNTVYMLT